MASKASSSDEIIMQPLTKEKDHAHDPLASLQPRPGQSPSHHSKDNDSDSDATATNSSDEFDWDEEEGATPAVKIQPRGRRLRALYLLFMKLSRTVRTLLVGILGAGIFITPLIVVNFKFNDSPVRPHVHAWSLWLSIIWAAACVTYLVVDIMPRLIIHLIVLFGGQVERLTTQIELTLAVTGWLKLFLDIIWTWISLSIIRGIYNPPGSYWTVINRVMQALFAASVLLLVEKLFLQFIAINFHQKALADRLAENRLGLKALDRLSNAQPAVNKKHPYKRGHKASGSFGNLDFMTHRGHKSTDSPDGHTADEKDISVKKSLKKADRARKRRKAMASVIVDQVSGAIGQVALKDSKFNRENDLSGLHSARRLARKLFSMLSDVVPPRSHLIVEDFYPYFKSTAEATAAFALFDKDSNGDISKKEMREAVQRIYRERKALVASLKDVSSAVAKLDAVMLFVALLIMVFISLLIFDKSDTITSLVPMATIVLGFSFIFGTSAQLLFESLIFIFSTHVFDVGDLVLIDDQALFVKEFGLFSTTFRRVDGQEIIAPNAILASSKLIHNLRRSKSMWESTTLQVSYSTPLETIETLRNKVSNYVAEHNREWSGSGLTIDKMEYQNTIYLIISLEHRSNWQDWGGRWTRRNEFMRYLKEVLEELEVYYTMPVQPILLPRAPTGSTANSRVSIQPGYSPSTEDLGNSGYLQSGGYGTAPTRGIRNNVSPQSGLPTA